MSDPRADHRPTFIFRTAEAWDAMYADCEAAKISIEFEQYIIMDDPAGARFLSLFARKAREGVKVRLIFDGIGSRGIMLSRYPADIRAAGGDVYFYNSLLSWRAFMPWRWLPRSHVKTMLIDGTIAHTGSACVWNIMRHWHDIHCRTTGPVVADIARHFEDIWKAKENHGRITGLPPRDGAGISYAVSAPAFGTNPIYRELLLRIRQARRTIRLATPYFLPPGRLRRALERAARRGVRVEILMSAQTDVPLADHVSHSYFPRFLRKGFHLFLYPHTVLHAKYVVIDDEWATVGSMNMDYLSLLKNREANLIIRTAEIAADLGKTFSRYISESPEADASYCKGIPLPHKIAGYLGRCVKKVL